MKRYPPHPLTRPEMEALLAACKGKSRTATRNRAHLAVLYRTGIRASESCNLRIEDVEHRSRGLTLRIREPKGFKNGSPPREMALDGRSRLLLEAWLKLRGDGPGWLFSTYRNEQVLPSYLRQLLPRLAKRAGINRRVHPHAFRHTFARELYDEGNGVVEIQLALGHSKIVTTQRYLTSIGATQVNEILRRRKW